MTGRRVHERYDCDLEVTLRVEGSDGVEARELHVRTLNMSLGGMYLLSEDSLPYGTPVKVTFKLPAIGELTTCDGIVRWNKPDGIGVQFGSLRAIEVWALNQLFKTLEASPG